ncbi:MAG: zinc ribbon domain-containing protein [Clostridiales bacterium]|nr:zinc ribbon domain-containing protein [Clostridiales bacterium]
MANEFFDGLGETITKTAKELGERAEKMYESQRIRNRLTNEQKIVERLKYNVGNTVYARYSSGEDVDGELAALCEEIAQHTKKVAHYKDVIAARKGEKYCPSCHKAVMREAVFCPYCGAACPSPEPEEPSGAQETSESGEPEETTAETGEESPEETEACEDENQGQAAEGECDGAESCGEEAKSGEASEEE